MCFITTQCGRGHHMKTQGMMESHEIEEPNVCGMFVKGGVE